MPLLGQRRQPPAPGTATPLAGRPPRLVFFLRHSWPLAWAGLHLLGVVAGGRLCLPAPRALANAPAGWGRVALLTPLLACGTGVPGAVAAGVATFGLAAAWGWGEAAARTARADATAATPWGVAVPVAREGAAVLRVTGWPAPAADGRWRAPARLVAWRDAARAPALTPSPGTGVIVTGRGPAPPFGGLVAGRLRLARPRGAGIEGGFDYRFFLAGRGLEWTARTDSLAVVAAAGSPDPLAVVGSRWLQPLQERLLAALGRVLPPREASLSASVLLGARDDDSRRSSEPFNALGLAHMFSVSGLHVAILLGLVLTPARLAGLGPGLSALPLLLLPPYAVLTGLAGPVIRAAGAGILALLAPCLGRRFDAFRALGLLYGASVAWEPFAALDVGLRLSYVAAAGILAASRVTGGLRFGDRRPWAWLAGGLAVTLAAQWATLPLTAQAFGRLPLLSPAANLVAVPLFGVAVWTTVLALVLEAAWPFAGQACGALAWLQLRLLAAGAGWSAAHSRGWEVGLVPPATWQFLAWLLLGALLLAGLQRLLTAGRPVAALGLLALSAPGGLALLVLPARTPALRTTVELHQFDVGQGDCGFLRFPDGWCTLLDTGGVFGGRGASEGPCTREVLPWLSRRGLDHLDAVVLTHGHRDHTGGAAAIAQRLAVDRWYCGGRAAEALAGAVPGEAVCDRPDSVLLHAWRDWSAVLLAAPAAAGERLDENDCSLVLVLRQGAATRLVWSGDLEEPGEARLLAARPGLAAAEVWKAGHHGSDTSGGGPWLARLRPGLVLVSCGVGNRYGHPSHGPYVVAGDTLAVLRSDLHGTIRVRWGKVGEAARVASTWAPAATRRGAGPAP